MNLNLDEARYGKTFLLLFKVCAFTLRRVIDNHNVRHGYTSLQDFLDKNKHDLYHILNRRCCCRLFQSSVTPMNWSQWNLLFIKNSSSCCTGTKDCPCQYDAKPGVTSDVMDITLCCLVIKNICSRHGGIKMLHIETIRKIRNDLIHAKSPRVDLLTFDGYWKDVKTALSGLANHVPPTVNTDALNMMQELEARVMDAYELGEIRKVMVDQKRIEKAEEIVKEATEKITKVEVSMTEMADNAANTETKLKDTTEKVCQLEVDMTETTGKVAQIEEDIKQTSQKVVEVKGSMANVVKELTVVGDTVQKIEASLKHNRGCKRGYSHLEDSVAIPNINTMKQILIKTNDAMTKTIQLSPLNERSKDGLPIDMLFASVVIREDENYTEKGQYSSAKMSSISEGKGDRSSSETDSESEAFSEQSREVTNPAEIFIKNNELVKKIYMLGDAAHGKTTFCLWLLKNWLNVQQKLGNESEELNEWKKIMAHYDFVFHLQFRNVEPHLASVTDMICENVFGSDTECGAAIRHVLSSTKYRSLIIMDGLDEWNPSEETRRKLACQRIPNIRVSSTVSCFFSMRPWVFALISKIVKINDKVIEILGLKDSEIENVVEKMLLSHYKLRKDSSKYIDIYDKIIRRLNTESLRSFMRIPLLAVVCVQIWGEGKEVGKNLTSFYAAMLNMLIQRAQKMHEIQMDDADKNIGKVPDILSNYKDVENCISLLLKLGKVAYEGLLTDQPTLVFQKAKLEDEIGVREIKFALDVGLISQKEAPSIFTKNLSVHFFHKSLQEFLAVIYLVTNKEVCNSFYKHLSNVKDIMRFSNVIMFICGICPSLGSAISQHVVSVTDRDSEICQYRELANYNSTVEELYKLQVSWYSELRQGLSETPLPFHVSDIFLSGYMSQQTMRVTRKILTDSKVDIRSVWVRFISTFRKYGIDVIELNDFLSNEYNNTSSLVMFRIEGRKTGRMIPALSIPTLRVLHLESVRVPGPGPGPALESDVCPSLLTNMNLLRVIYFGFMGLRGCMIGLSAEMIHLEKVELEGVSMSAADWQHFIRSLQSIHHRFKVELKTEIDEESKKTITSSPDFNVTHQYKYELYFTRVWPLSKVVEKTDTAK